ncbi:HD domain-containing phosphohydrolase [Marinomonas balearica]|uniref:Response regulator receiver domain-containing protein n=1 Tax=Marinomonas balearica TaxID=491947 RepID=A0A4R6MDH7_9GAMM|nr:HD domain-containing phosphohydrolase [Marinomonas balearica]TDO99446.1 response regulator receiver domain-containing protein [Marinomonas balearica]
MKNSLFAAAHSNPKKSETNSLVSTMRPWKVLLIDDEKDVISVSKMAVKDLFFENAPIQILEANSGLEARTILNEHNDIALALVDVVMETDSAGLDLVKWIREEQKNAHIRLVLRTGQPGQAPEETVIHQYEINDYKHKTDMTASRLKTTILASLRSYRDLMAISSNQRKVEHMLESCSSVLAHSNVNAFLRKAQEEISSFLKQSQLNLGISFHAYVPYAEKSVTQFYVSNDSIQQGQSVDELAETLSQFEQNNGSPQAHQTVLERGDTYVTHQVSTDEFSHVIVHVNFPKPLTKNRSRLLPLFTTNIALAFEKICAKREVENVQEELMLMLSEAIEERSKETGAHVRRVAHICEFIGSLIGLPEKHVHMIKHAAPMHDLGKIGIPESILHKPDKLTDEEWHIMRSHPTIGYKLLSRSKHGLPRMGAMVSIAHHEKWDGSGYPNGTSGEDIPLEGRIMAIADVIDALGSNRSYKKAWSSDEISTFLDEQKGRHFDPELCHLVIQNFDEIMRIRDQFPDPKE